MTIGEQIDKAALVAEWFERRSYEHARFGDAALLAKHKQDRSLSVSVVLPCREVASTVGEIIDAVHALNERAPLVDQIVAIDAASADGTAAIAASHRAEVYMEDELMNRFGPAIGKGDAMWRALAIVRGDLVLYLDADTLDFGPHFLLGLLGPLLEVPQIRFVKAAYRRVHENAHDDGGRVTELAAKPLFNVFYPELTGFAQPLAGEFGGTRELLLSIPFFTGYAVEAGMMVDVLAAAGLHAMAQVDLGSRTHRPQSIFELGRMSYAVLRAIESRLREEGRLREPGSAGIPGLVAEADGYLHARRSSESLHLDHHVVEVIERPPMADVLGHRAGAGARM